MRAFEVDDNNVDPRRPLGAGGPGDSAAAGAGGRGALPSAAVSASAAAPGGGGNVKIAPLPHDDDDGHAAYPAYPSGRGRTTGGGGGNGGILAAIKAAIGIGGGAGAAATSSGGAHHRTRCARCVPRGVDPRTAARTLFFVLSWYFLSTCLGLFNKVLVGNDHKGMFGRGAFPAPLFLSATQFAFQWFLAEGALRSGLAQRSPRARPLTRDDYLRIALPNGVTTGLDIGFSNKSLVYITMSFYTMCKSTTPVWLLLFAFLWGLEKPSWALGGVVAVIVAGLLLLVRGEVDFHLLGFVLVMTAACLSGLRFTLTQVLLHGRKGAGGGGGSAGGGGGSGGGAAAAAAANGAGAGGGAGPPASREGSGTGGGSGLHQHHHHHHHHPQGNGASSSAAAAAAAPGGARHNSSSGGHNPAHSHKPAAFGGPLEIVALLTPIMSVTTFILSLAWERVWHTLPGSPYFSSPGRALATLGLILFSALLAFLMVWAEYQVIRETSALTFMVCGIVKEVLTVLVAVLLLGDHFTPANALGLAVVIVGVALFNLYKYRRLVQAQQAGSGGGGSGGGGGGGGEEEDGVGRDAEDQEEGEGLLLKGVRVAEGELRDDEAEAEEKRQQQRRPPGIGGGAVFDLESAEERSQRRALSLQRRSSAGGSSSGGTPPASHAAAAAGGGGSNAPPLPASTTIHVVRRGSTPPSLRTASAAVMGAELGGLEGLVATAAEVDEERCDREHHHPHPQQQQQQQQH
jgi:drug/metabolite transporter (DMT)-like permease